MIIASGCTDLFVAIATVAIFFGVRLGIEGLDILRKRLVKRRKERKLLDIHHFEMDEIEDPNYKATWFYLFAVDEKGERWLLDEGSKAEMEASAKHILHRIECLKGPRLKSSTRIEVPPMAPKGALSESEVDS